MIAIRIFVSVLTLSLLFGSSHLIAADIRATGPVTISDSSQYVIHSETIGQNFRIDVAMPVAFPIQVTDTYPVVYVLDGNSIFPIVYSNARVLQGGPEMVPAIFVGIGYDTTIPLEIVALRDRDLTPTYDESYHEQLNNRRLIPLPFQVESGGAANFINFIEREVKPFVNANYPTDSSNETLVGYSLGGLFSLYVLLNHTDSFDKYVIGSPSIWWDDSISLTYEENYAQSHTDLAKSVFISANSLETERTRTDVNSMYNRLLDRNYENLKIEKIVFEGETHMSGIGVSLNRGLKNMFSEETGTYLNMLVEKITESENGVGAEVSQQPLSSLDLSVLTNVSEKLTISVKPSLVKAFRNANSTRTSERNHYTNNDLYYELESMDITVFEFEESARRNVINMFESTGSNLVGNNWNELNSEKNDQRYSQALTLFSDDGSTLLGGILMAVEGDRAIVASAYGMISTADIESADLEGLLDQSRYTNLFDNN